MTDFKKGGPLQNSNIYATNRLFVKNPLFKKRKKKRAPGVYNPKAKFKYEDGGEQGCPPGQYWDGKKCVDDPFTKGLISQIKKGNESKKPVPSLTRKAPTQPTTNAFTNKPLLNKEIQQKRKRNSDLQKTFPEVEIIGKRPMGTIHGEIPDSFTENLVEFADLSGYFSWDDANQAYQNWQGSDNMLPSMSQAADMFGAVPILGKFGKLKYLDPDAMKASYKYFPWQEAVNFFDTAEDIDTDNLNPIFFPNKKNGGSIMDLTEEEIQKYIDGGYVVEEVNDPSIPALTKAAKGGPKSRKLKKNKKDKTSEERKTIEVLDPSQEVFDLPKTQTGELYYEPITTKEFTEQELTDIVAYDEEQRKLQEEQKRLQAIETAKVNEPKYYDEGLQFVKDWHNSPMYNQMVLNSFQGNQKNADYLTSLRKKNLEDLPGLNIQEKEAENQADGIQPAAWSKTNSGLVEVFPGGYEYGPSLYVHELIHSGDRPRELYKYKHPSYNTGVPIDYFNERGINLGGTWTTDENNNVINYPDWMVYKDPRFPDEGHVWHDRVIPQTDNLYITTRRGSNWKDNEDYKIAQKEGIYSPQGRGEEYFKNRMINEWGYDPNSPDFNSQLQGWIDWDKDLSKDRLKNAPGNWKSFAHDYVSSPHEVRARLGEIRYFGKKEGIYDPFTERITPEIFQQYINKERDNDSWQPMQPIKDLRKDFTDEEILWMLQNISKNKHEKEGDEFAPQSTKYGGSKNKYIEVDIPEKEIQWYIDNGYRVEPVTKLKKFIG